MLSVAYSQIRFLASGNFSRSKGEYSRSVSILRFGWGILSSYYLALVILKLPFHNISAKACLDKRDCWHSLSMERGAFWILNRWDIILSYSKKAPHSFDEIMQKGRTHQPHWFNWPCQFNAAKTVLILSFFCRDQLREWGQFHVSNDSTMKVKKYLDRLN